MIPLLFSRHTKHSGIRTSVSTAPGTDDPIPRGGGRGAAAAPSKPMQPAISPRGAPSHNHPVTTALRNLTFRVRDSVHVDDASGGWISAADQQEQDEEKRIQEEIKRTKVERISHAPRPHTVSQSGYRRNC